ncbi:deoxyribonuclease-2-beta-like [Menidia menidia]
MWRMLLTLGLLGAGGGAQVTCRDENNAQRDWFILYKGANGADYVYIDSSGVRTPTTHISASKGVLANTLQPLFRSIDSMPKNFGFIDYNDQHKKCNVGSKMLLNQTAELDAELDTELDAETRGQNNGHSKGVVMVEKGGTGLWLLHSTPQFPADRTADGFWPASGSANGQTFICVTFKYDQFDLIGKHLQYIGACAFESRIPNDFHQSLIDAANGKKIPPNTNFVSLTSNGGTTFQSIAKDMAPDAKNGDLYVTISKQASVRSDLKAQTWGRQVQRDKSYCERNQYKVLNVQQVNVYGLGFWTASHDHSKWCVSTDQNRPWTCIADVNRGPTQYQRRGGALCIQDLNVRNAFTGFIAGVEDCSSFMSIFNDVADKSLELVKLLAKSFFAQIQ